jgi:predicted PurR-regulated permease PerM
MKKLVIMKKSAISLITASMLLFFTPSITQAGVDVHSNSKAGSAAKIEEAAKAEAMINRLEEIKAMDVAAMSPSQKKELQKEVKTIQSDLQGLSGGVYISASALIVILILLVLFL